MVKITGGKGASDRLRRMIGPELTAEVGKALFTAGQYVQVHAQISITRGAVSGKGHVPSKPGEPPKADTHRLADNIETVQVSPLKVEVSSTAPYSVALEFGTSRVAARPYMRPATERTRPKVLELVQLAVRRVKGRA